MSKAYKKVKLKKDRVYSVEELKAAFSVTANTVSNWVGEGLRPSDGQRPNLFQGATVQEYHRTKRRDWLSKLRPGQFHCRRCQSAVFPAIETVEDAFAKNGKHMYSALCPQCSSKLQKISGETDRDLVEDCRNPNTPTECLHEGNTSICGDIWTSGIQDAPGFHTANDRIIHKWQTYAGRHCEKTIVRHLSAIRYFEGILGGKLFSKLTNNDFATVREDLKRRADVGAPDRLSASSIKHRVSHLVAFFNWLLIQDGYKRLPKDFAGYLQLPKAVVARSAPVMQKEFPDLREAAELLNAMPNMSLIDQRTRALFALAFLGALRADTLVSLRIKHVDIEKKLILQDASVVRAKAGKSLNVFWFKIPVTFETVVLNWVQTLQRLGFAEDDALFPDTKYLKHRIGSRGQKAATVPVMSTTHAVTAAFATACRNCTTKYTPHAAKHTIGAERDIRSLTHEERKAWSLNMGHDSAQTTELHYGTMPDDRRFEVLESIGSQPKIDPRSMSEAEKAVAFDAMLKAINGNA